MALRASDLGSPPLEAHPLSLHFDLETELPSTTVAHDVRLLLPNNGPSLAHAQALRRAGVARDRSRTALTGSGTSMQR